VCGDPHHGFARVYCDVCWHDYLLAFMLLTRGPTDPRATVEFTDWKQVDAFGRLISDG